MSDPGIGNTFPNGWEDITNKHDMFRTPTWWREVDGLNSSVVYALMSLPADTEVGYAGDNYGGVERTRIMYYYPDAKKVELM